MLSRKLLAKFFGRTKSALSLFISQARFPTLQLPEAPSRYEYSSTGELAGSLGKGGGQARVRVRVRVLEYGPGGQWQLRYLSLEFVSGASTRSGRWE